MIIEPLEGCDKGITYYEKVDNGYLIWEKLILFKIKLIELKRKYRNGKQHIKVDRLIM